MTILYIRTVPMSIACYILPERLYCLQATRNARRLLEAARGRKQQVDSQVDDIRTQQATQAAEDNSSLDNLGLQLAEAHREAEDVQSQVCLLLLQIHTLIRRVDSSKFGADWPADRQTDS